MQTVEAYLELGVSRIILGTVAKENPALVADACRTLLADPKSPDACRARACEFDRDTQFEAYVRLYEELIG